MPVNPNAAIEITAFRWVPEFAQGLVRDLRVRWALEEAGLDYVIDWPNDEQPYEMRCGERSLISLPVSCDLDDVIAHWQHKLSMPRWRRAAIEAVDQLCVDGAENGRVLILNIHPWLMGQAFRSTYLAEVLDHVRACPDVWIATTGDIASAYRAQL